MKKLKLQKKKNFVLVMVMIMIISLTPLNGFGYDQSNVKFASVNSIFDINFDNGVVSPTNITGVNISTFRVGDNRHSFTAVDYEGRGKVLKMTNKVSSADSPQYAQQYNINFSPYITSATTTAFERYVFEYDIMFADKNRQFSYAAARMTTNTAANTDSTDSFMHYSYGDDAGNYNTLSTGVATVVPTPERTDYQTGKWYKSVSTMDIKNGYATGYVQTVIFDENGSKVASYWQKNSRATKGIAYLRFMQSHFITRAGVTETTMYLDNLKMYKTNDTSFLTQNATYSLATSNWTLTDVGGSTTLQNDPQNPLDSKYYMTRTTNTAGTLETIADLYVYPDKTTAAAGVIALEFDMKRTTPAVNKICFRIRGSNGGDLMSFDWFGNNTFSMARATKLNGTATGYTTPPYIGDVARVKIIMDTPRQMYSMWVNGTPMIENAYAKTAGTVDFKYLRFWMGNINYDSTGETPVADGMYIDNFFVYQVDLSNLQKTEFDAAEVSLENLLSSPLNTDGALESNLNLPISGSMYLSTITWQSSHPEIISNEGVLTKPSAMLYASDPTVTLTASFQLGNYIKTKDFTFKVARSMPVKYLKVLDSNNNEISNHFTDTTLKLKLTALDNEELNASMLLACYNKNKMLLNVTTKSVNILSDAILRDDEITIDIPSDTTTINAFLFNGINTLVPLVKNMQFAGVDNLSVPVYFADNMVLQRGEDVNIWGNVTKGREVTVAFGEQTKTVIADSNGNWSVKLDPMSANAVGQDLVISTERESKIFHNILVGEVWMVTGQSNAAFTMSQFSDTAADVASANYPLIRYMRATYSDLYATATPPMLDEYSALINQSWAPMTPALAANAGATAFYYARELQSKLGVPVGIINNAKGGKPIREFLPAGSIQSASGDYVANGIVYNELINPFFKYTIKGVVWYQGENDYNNPQYYTAFYKKVTEVYRANFNKPNLPFHYVQLQRYDNGRNFQRMREAMRQLPEHISNVYMTSIIDAGTISEPINNHPNGKNKVGEKLVASALYHTYGQTDVVPSGPFYKSHTINGSNMIIKFDYVGTGLEVKNSENLQGFVIAGSDGIFYPATATITGIDEVTVSAAQVTEPVNVRYIYEPFPEPVTLFNNVGYPASPFTTDVKYPVNLQ